MVRVADPVRTGLVSSLARPGGNITGLSFTVEELSVKQLQLLKEVMPSISRVAVLWYAGNPGTAVIIRDTEAACAQLGLRLVRLPVQGPEDLRPAGEAARRDRAEALIVLDDAFITKHTEQIVSLAAEHRLPLVSLYKPFAAAGGLFAYGASTAPLYRRAAHYIDKVLKGAKPADLPIEQPTEFELVVNLKTARGLGLTIPPSMLLRADQVIE
jgi:putative ABC transport system substrate-binding protein